MQKLEVATPRSRRTTGGGGNMRAQKKDHMARMQTQLELSCQYLYHGANGWLVQVGTKKEPQLDRLPKEEGMEEQFPGKPG